MHRKPSPRLVGATAGSAVRQVKSVGGEGLRTQSVAGRRDSSVEQVASAHVLTPLDLGSHRDIGRKSKGVRTTLDAYAECRTNS